MWLGGGSNAANIGSWNGMRDPWALYVIGQSRIETWIMLEPVGIRMTVRMATDGHLYPDNPLGRYLYSICPTRITPTTRRSGGSTTPPRWRRSSAKRGGSTGTVRSSGSIWAPPNPYVRWIPNNDGSVRIIRAIDPEAMKKDMFDTLNGSPTRLIGTRPRAFGGKGAEGMKRKF